MDADAEFLGNSAGRMMGLWFDLASNMTQAMLAGGLPQTPPEAFRHARSAQLNAWNEYLQQFMRTPEFLGMMKQWTATTVQFRKQWSDFLGRLQHEFQGASRQDIDQLMLSVRHLESRVVEGIEDLAGQLEDLETRMASLESLQERNGRAKSGEIPERRSPERRRKRHRKKHRGEDS